MNLFTLFLSALLVTISFFPSSSVCARSWVFPRSSAPQSGMGIAVIFVIFGASVLSWVLYYFVLQPMGLEYMKLISLILLIAAFVQFVEMYIKKNSPFPVQVSRHLSAADHDELLRSLCRSGQHHAEVHAD